MTPRDQLEFHHARVVDGGMASELEFLGADITGPLWSAHVLEDAPEKVVAVHRAYLEAGAEILLTASYQVSRQGYLEHGLTAEAADRALLRAVEIADQARHAFPGKKVLIAASLGPYGAALHNGSEYTGNYDCTFDELVRFHQERITVLADSNADLLAFDTIPSLEEAHAISQALEPWPELAVWLSFTCPDGHAQHLEVAHGELLYDCASLAANLLQSVAIGVNCTQPKWMAKLIPELRRAIGGWPGKAIVLYPNSGGGWDAKARRWTGPSDPIAYGQLARAWYAAGAQLIGGCCRTRPEHIRQVAWAAGKQEIKA